MLCSFKNMLMETKNGFYHTFYNKVEWFLKMELRLMTNWNIVHNFNVNRQMTPILIVVKMQNTLFLFFKLLGEIQV